MEPPTLRDGELVASPRAGIEEPIYVRYVWEST
jgi:hypothetical protein